MTETPTVGPVALPVDQFMESLTGFDEIAITRSWGTNVSALRQDPSTLVRALLFVHARRCGHTDAQAKDYALNLTIGEANRSFPETPEDDEGKEN